MNYEKIALFHDSYMRAFRGLVEQKRAADVLKEALDPQTLIKLNNDNDFSERFIVSHAAIAKDVIAAIASSDIGALITKLNEYIYFRLSAKVLSQPVLFTQINEVIEMVTGLRDRKINDKKPFDVDNLKYDKSQMFNEFQKVCNIQPVVIEEESPEEKVEDQQIQAKDEGTGKPEEKAGASPQTSGDTKEERAVNPPPATDPEAPADQTTKPPALDLKQMEELADQTFELFEKERKAFTGKQPVEPAKQTNAQDVDLETEATPIKGTTQQLPEMADESLGKIIFMVMSGNLSPDAVNQIVKTMIDYIASDKKRERMVINALLEEGAYDVVAAYDAKVKSNGDKPTA